jgi:hypothetical protein
MRCEQVRQLFAAYRLGDVSEAERAAIMSHLTGCQDCRKRFAEYHRVGDYIRDLPLITPPPELRRRIAASLEAERYAWYSGHRRYAQRSPRYIARLALIIGAPAATGIAALVMIILLFMQMLPAITPTNFKHAVQAIGTGSPLTILSETQPRPDIYIGDPAYPYVTDALASSTDIVYTATDRHGATMLELLNRANGQSTPLLAQPSAAPVSLEARSDQWVLWMQGLPSQIGAWKLNATSLAAAAGTTLPLTITLVDSTSMTGTLQVAGITGVAIHGAQVLVAETLNDGRSQLLAVDLIDPSHPDRVQLVTALPGHTIVHPVIAAGAFYWADEWFENGNVLHSDIWSLKPGGTLQQQTFGGDAFDPMVAAGKLFWLENMNGGVLWGPDSTADFRNAGSRAVAQFRGWRAALNEHTHGVIMVKDLQSGQVRSVSNSDAITDPEQGGGDLAIWEDGSQTDFFDLVTGQRESLNGYFASASFVSVNGRSIAWVVPGHNNAAAQIQVLDVSPGTAGTQGG